MALDQSNVRVKEIERGRDSYARRAWADAYDAFSRANQTAALEADDLERLAWSAGLTARDDELLKLSEQLYQARVESGDQLGAARAAFWLGFRLSGMGEMGRASGWLARAQRIVDSQTSECVLRGYLLLPVIYRNLMSGQIEAAEAAATEALAIAERCRDRDLIAFLRQIEGRILLQQGRIEEGLALFDEAMVAVTADELSPLLAGLIYCSVIALCQKVYALHRAREWTSALADWCQAQPQLVTFTGSCLVHRSEIMQLTGDWPKAIEEAQRAAERLTRPIEKDAAAHAVYQQAEIHRLRGEFTEAEEAYRRASQLGREPQPGLALLRLAQRRHDAAASAIRRVIGTTTDRLQRAGLLPAYLEILLVIGALDEARVACEELEQIATSLGTDVIGAMAAHARGAILIAEGNAAAALDPLRRSFGVWQQIGAPYIASRIRVLLGIACRALGDHDTAELELEAARKVFEELGAVPDVARVDAFRNTPEPVGAANKTDSAREHGLTARELEVLRLVASGKTNKTIAKELCLSEKTIDRHVSNIFVKVDVASRAAATAFAYEHGLI